jgi:hypothetical protein
MQVSLGYRTLCIKARMMLALNPHHLFCPPNLLLLGRWTYPNAQPAYSRSSIETQLDLNMSPTGRRPKWLFAVKPNFQVNKYQLTNTYLGLLDDFHILKGRNVSNIDIVVEQSSSTTTQHMFILLTKSPYVLEKRSPASTNLNALLGITVWKFNLIEQITIRLLPMNSRKISNSVVNP